MRKSWIILFVLLLGLSGCKMDTMLQADTIVDILLKSTQATQNTTEAITEPDTEPFTFPDFSKAPGNGENPGQTANQGETPAKATQPPAVEPPETTPPTLPPVDTAAIYDISDYVPGNLEYAILTAVNTRRAGEGIEELRLDDTLCGISSVRAYEASVNRSHTRPDGRNGLTVLDDYGYSVSGAVEVLYFTSVAASAEHTVRTWMNSDQNRRSLLETAYESAGVGIYRTPDGMTYIAAIFVK